MTSIKLTAGYREMTDVPADLARALSRAAGQVLCTRCVCVSVVNRLTCDLFDVSQMMMMIRILLKMAAHKIRLTRVRVSPHGGARDTANCTPEKTSQDAWVTRDSHPVICAEPVARARGSAVKVGFMRV